MITLFTFLKVLFFVLGVINYMRNIKDGKKLPFADAAKKFMEWFEKNREKFGKEFQVDQGLIDLEDTDT